MKLKNFFEATGYRITEGGEHGWGCYGPNAYYLDSNRDIDTAESAGASIIFDTKTQEVFEVEVYDYERNNYYRWFAPGCAEAHHEEAEARGVKHDEAFEGERFCDLEVEEDILDKIAAIMSGKPYDERVLIPLTVDDDTLLELFKRAHAEDKTFNQYVIDILQEQLDLMTEAKEGQISKDEWDFS